MSTPSVPEVNPRPSIRNVKSQDFKTVYSNNMAMLTGYFDVNFFMGEMIAVEGDNVVVEQKLKVIMNPAQAKIFCVLLWQQIRLYEEQYGKLEVSEQMVPPELAPFLRLYNELRDAKNPG